MSWKDNARCPGCGAWGDAPHVIACIGGRVDRAYAEGWRAGALTMIGAAAKQVVRRGALDVGRLVDAVRAQHDVRPGWRRR